MSGDGQVGRLQPLQTRLGDTSRGIKRVEGVEGVGNKRSELNIGALLCSHDCYAALVRGVGVVGLTENHART